MRNKILFASIVMLAATTQLNSQDPELERRVDHTIREQGVIESAKSSEIRSSVNATIISLVDEGKMVKKGELLVQLKETVLEKQLEQQSIEKSKLVVKVADVKIGLENLRDESKDEIAFHESVVHVAQLKLDRFTLEGGELSSRKKQAEAEVVIAEKRLASAKSIVELTKKQNLEGVLSLLELAKADLIALEAQKQLEIAKREQLLLQNHIAPHEIALRELEVQSASLTLSKSTREFERQIQSMEAELAAAELSLAVTIEELSRLDKLKSRDKITASQAGIVIYENQAASRNAVDNTIRVGSQVRENQIILKVVDLEKLQLKVGVHESQIARVRLGQSVVIRVDAFPQREFTGEVLKINQTPETATWPNTNYKEFAVMVSINNPPDSLRLGLTALAEIDVAD